MKHEKTDSSIPYIPLSRDKFDPLGSYTGRPVDIDEIPVQDADDL